MNAQLKSEHGQLLLDVPEADYHRKVLQVASNSSLRILREKTPAHLKAYTEAPEQPGTPAMAFGRAYHCRMLEPAKFAATYCVRPDFGDLRTNVGKAARDAWLADHAGMQTLTKDDSDRIEAMAAALQAHPLAWAILSQGHSEVTMYWNDRQTGVPCKARADKWHPGKLFADLKTTDDASPEAFRRSVSKYAYHVQHAHYCDGAAACGEPVTNFLIVAQEKEAPYAVAVYQIDAAAEARGFELREQGLQLMKQCIDADAWPAYAPGITELSLPAWALKDQS